ncbi:MULTISPECIES: 16S rRNA (adenine(1518)-N(6)/adenine(1519)-N(6))-dimethyltransferase RsmA [Clostridiaceae]|uniref:Ribosomal RNA small subunit methyltransferase A n=1 Tax=Clostridium facile TaxID=2763035 RepID=A0ABR7IT34_9CLOT|nr:MULTISPECIES: 16S rRNA (adenine(1518)-N(6)/adenine(1519)-N(6))-dimethyltransferase RsmA [Clostridiaceae]MBC5788300.1 16S rRNA (adenine(1518)-N(6)/adenine(1519)-N(6))-dimethyltransferase RsmA [Clostridium facile]
MENLSNISTIKAILTKHGFTFSKSLGQNFLVNPSVCPRIAEQGGAKQGVGVIEVGTGIGVLTSELAQRADKVVAVEIDQRLLPVLEETLSDYHNIKIINQDILKVDLHKLIQEEFAGMQVVVCANLPYYITSPVIMYLLESRLPIDAVTVMVQKEAAIRICAQPGTRDVGAVSLAVRYFSEPRILFQVSRGSFMPAPNVDSCVIRLDIKKETPQNILDEKLFFRLVKAAFSQRRKTLVNPVSGSLGVGKPRLKQLMEESGIKSTARAEELTMEQFIQLANGITMLKK